MSTRYAIAYGPADTIRAYLPRRYRVLKTLNLDGREACLIGGEDDAGWTLDDYVIPRLASGLYRCVEAPACFVPKDEMWRPPAFQPLDTPLLSDGEVSS